MKYLPHLALACAIMVLLAQSLTSERKAEQAASRMGVSLAFESGQLHFRADLGAGSLAVRL